MELDEKEYGTVMAENEMYQKQLGEANAKVVALEAENQTLTKDLADAKDSLKKRDEADAASLRASIKELAKDSVKDEDLAPKSLVELRAMYDGMRLIPQASPTIDKVNTNSTPRKASDSLREDGWNGGKVK